VSIGDPLLPAVEKVKPLVNVTYIIYDSIENDYMVGMVTCRPKGILLCLVFTYYLYIAS